jgi:site-specific DNA recombinase
MNKKHLLQSQLEQLTTQRYASAKSTRGRDGIIYTRVSSLEQKQSNGSLEVQLKYCEQYAKQHSITVTEYFGGSYESAKTDGRKEFQRMIAYALKNKNISCIIVFNYDRFSRTGAAASQLSENLGKEGIIIKSVTQDIDTSTAIGRMQENFFHLINNFDNRLKSDRTVINTREVIEKGYWPYITPMGYKNFKPKHRACFHQYVITDQGKQIKKGFEMIVEQKYQFKDIIEKLQIRGVPVTRSSFRQVFANPFYAGFVTGKLVGGKLIKGQHPPLIDIDTFMKVQDILNGVPVAGVPKIVTHEEVPLKIFAKDDISGQPFTGYKTKGIWYYKTKQSASPVNVRANTLNNMFLETLKEFEYRSELRLKLEKVIKTGLKQRLSTQTNELATIKKCITEKHQFLEKIEAKYLADQIDEALYQKHATKVKEELAKLNRDLISKGLDGSNLETAVEKCLSIAQNISQAWVSADYQSKQRLQKLVFPDGILYNKEKGVVRTPRVNSLFAAIPLLTKVSDEKEKGDSSKNRLQSSKVPRTGIEPAHCCQYQILSLTRLPVPPSGQ